MRVSTFSLLKGATALTIWVLSLACCAAAQEAARAHGAHSGDLVSALEFTSKTFHLPIIAELTKSYPTQLSISAGEHSAEQLLSELTGQSSGYGWVNEGGVVLFYDKHLRDAPGNFFNAKIKRFVMPADLAVLKLELNQAMANPEQTAAPVMTGVLEPDLQTVKLRQGEVLTNVTGREVLVEAARQSRDVFSVVLFPTSGPMTTNDVSEAHMNWYVRSIDELPRNPMRLRSIPQPKAPER